MDITGKFNKFHSPALHILVIAALAAIVYSNTFSVPFHFDDKLNITDNAMVKDMDKLWPPSQARWFGYLTFAINYRINGLDPAGYHAVNIAIHVLNALLVYWLVLLTFKTPYSTALLKNDGEASVKARSSAIALLASLLFAVHPVQTQAVTYIVQRFASLAAFFYLFSLTTYIKARLAGLRLSNTHPGAAQSHSSRWYFYAISMMSAILGMKTKEMTFTLPAVIMLYEFAFLAGSKFNRRSLLYLVPFLMAVVVMLLSVTGFGTDFNNVLTATNEISRHDYLVTQFRVLVTYLRLVLLPVGQTIDYDYPVYRSFFDPNVFFSFLFLTALFGTAVFLFIRSRTSLSRRLIAFGIIWFFITISVESSIIPIADVIFEHRLYLPGAGLFIAFSAMAVSLGEMLGKRYGQRASITFLCAVTAVIAVLSSAAFIRNTVWRSEISLWEDVVEKQPYGVRAHSMLGILYQRYGRIDLAIQKFSQAIKIRPSYAEAHVNLGSAYVDQGRLDEGMKEFMIALNLRSLDDIDTANLFINIGNCYLKKSMPDRAIEFFNYAVPIIPDDATVYLFLGRAYEAKGMKDKASEHFGRAHRLNPDLF